MAETVVVAEAAMNCPVPVTAGSPLRERCHLCLGIFKKGWEQLGPGDGRRLVRVHERRHRRTDAREDKRGSCKEKCDEIHLEKQGKGVSSKE